MQALLEFAPFVAFIIAYKVGGLYTATAVLMVASVVVLAIDYLMQRRIPTMHGVSAGLVLFFGAATLLLHDKHFIQIKPTILFWAIAIAFLGSFWIGERTLTERLLTAALQDQVHAPRAVWRRLNTLWVVFYLALGALNLVLLSYASEKVWVYFKVVDTVLAVVFVGVQVAWLIKRWGNPQEVQEPPPA